MQSKIFLLWGDIMAGQLKMGLWSMKFAAGSDLNHADNQIRWSDEMRHLLGFTDINDFPDTIDSWVNCLVEEHKQPTLDAVLGALDNPDCFDLYDVEYQLKIKDGSLHWYHAQGNVERDDSGKPVRLVGSIENIDEDRQASGDKEFRNNVNF
ncbi:MAG: hypothetical protein CSB24_03505 [Deltaproteobacteria bacterium]|nr:MAG: hypothetical protein CSB24_03505 [Deltaproteobacteria bacterium]